MCDYWCQCKITQKLSEVELDNIESLYFVVDGTANFLRQSPILSKMKQLFGHRTFRELLKVKKNVICVGSHPMTDSLLRGG